MPTDHRGCIEVLTEAGKALVQLSIENTKLQRAIDSWKAEELAWHESEAWYVERIKQLEELIAPCVRAQ